MNKDIDTLCWRDLVKETLQRRKQEGMTQREHAALADVSIPTMAAFENEEKTLSIQNATKIMNAVSLFNDPSPLDFQNMFIDEALQDWQRIYKSSLPFYQLSYELMGDLKSIERWQLKQNLIKTVSYSKISPFYCPDKYTTTTETDEIIHYSDINTKHYWKASTEGRFSVIRPYEEDFQETIVPGTIFDSIMPIWRMTEVLLHAKEMAHMMKKKEDSEIAVNFKATYRGLDNRILFPRSAPDIQSLFNLSGRYSRMSTINLDISLISHEISKKLVPTLQILTQKIYDEFGIKKIPDGVIETIVERVLAYPERNRR